MDPRPTAERPGRLDVGVVGAGRVGSVLGAALTLAGHTVVGASGISAESRRQAETHLPGVPLLSPQEVVARSSLALLTVPDDALPDLVGGLAATGVDVSGTLLVHTSGRYGYGVLDPATRAGALPLALHP
ncbi:MAG: oxidoreductase, partial [Pseudonocardiaceae bacterium]|nr:oxidoreductase [Pseudonocardiaceae bacterium]